MVKHPNNKIAVD